MKSKIYIVTKYIAAGSLKEALSREKRSAPDSVYIDETTVKAMCDELAEAPRKLYTARNIAKKKSVG